MSLFLCVDCGGSKTSAVICDSEGKILGRSYGGPSNLAYLGVENFLSAVRNAVGDALKTCSSPPSVDPVSLPPPPDISFAAAWLGVSGVDSPAAVNSILQPLSDLLGIPVGPRLSVANDTHLLAAPVQMHDDVSCAVTVVGGTGAIAVSFRQKADQSLEELGRAGGWGWILGDEGGGFSVGREAIRELLSRKDRESVCKVPGTPPKEGSLEDRVLKHFSVKHIMDVLTEVHARDPGTTIAESEAKSSIISLPPHLMVAREKRLSSLSPLVFAAAYESNDPEALIVIKKVAGMLAEQIAVLVGESSQDKPGLVRASDSVISFGGSLVGLGILPQVDPRRPCG
ncbi:hypothetical protein VNI00_007468 [Paramarasmius palmivorus]|uniref:N-acetyl-D-glucosamine kinase n=1 Tax=Paramarasmius palmivorus TaxID=297713 RepID=A0AAW0D4G3_9AGAR